MDQDFTVPGNKIRLWISLERVRVVASDFCDAAERRASQNLIAQFGFHPSWNGTRWARVGKDARHADALNRRGTASFAGGSKTQIFVNLAENKHLDREGGVFAQVSGMEVLDAIHTGYKEGTGQIKAYNKGVAALMRQFPKMSHLETCRVVTR